MDGAKVSIITCLYNVSSFLPQGLDCLVNQSYENLEIIIVDDGSCDDSLEKCKEVAKKDSRIRIFNKENGGLGSARNMGLDNATGDYIYFYDVDDRIELDLVEKNVELMDEKQAELIVFGFYVYDVARQQVDSLTFKEHFIESNEDLKSVFLDELLFVRFGNGFAWNKFYKRSFIEKYHIRFENQRIQQDEVFNLKFYPLLNRVYISPDKLYHYYIYNTGNTRSKYIRDRFDIYLSIFNHLLDFANIWGISDSRFMEYTYKRFYAGIENTVVFNTFHKCSPLSMKEKKTEIIRILENKSVQDCIKYIGTHCDMGIEQRLYYNAFVSKSFFKILLLKNLFVSLRRIRHRISRK